MSEHAGRPVFVIIPDTQEGESLKLEVAQPNAKVVQPVAENDVESRLSALESLIDEIKELIFQNNLIYSLKSSKEFQKERPSRDLNPSRSLHRAY